MQQKKKHINDALLITYQNKKKFKKKRGKERKDE